MRTLKGFNDMSPAPVDCLCFTATAANSTIKLTTSGSPTPVNLQIKKDGIPWEDYIIGNTITLSSIGDKIYIRNKSNTTTSLSTSTSNYYKFIMTGRIAGSGDLNYLLNKNSTTTLSNYCFYYMFYGCTSLTTAPSLPATTVPNFGYNCMFNGCTNLVTAPSLPATTLGNKCYTSMFSGCSNLTTGPSSLPATTVPEYGYSNMFRNCTSLTTAPTISATTINQYSCDSMFNGCTNLTTTQGSLLITSFTGSNGCSSMFKGCTSLITAPSLPATSLGSSCYEMMFQNCTSLTSVPKLSSTSLGNDCYRSMFNGCTNLTELPALKATTVSYYGYYRMFYGCTRIKLSETQTGEYQIPYRIPTTGTGSGNTNYLKEMFTNTGGTFATTPALNTTYYTSNNIVS